MAKGYQIMDNELNNMVSDILCYLDIMLDIFAQ